MVPAPNIHVHPEEFTRNSNHLKNIAGKSNVTNFFVLEDGEKSSQLYKLVTTAKSEGFNSSSNEATKKKILLSIVLVVNRDAYKQVYHYPHVTGQ